MSRHLAPVGNAPVKVLRTLANDDDIAVAGPVLKYAPRLAETDLVGVATTKSQAHLKAISARPTLGEAVTDVLVRRGDREVARCVADNRGARISQDSFVSLVRRAEDDGILAEKVGLRPDIPEPMFRELLIKATAVVRNRLLVAATAGCKAEIHRVLAKVSKEVGARVGPRDYGAAQRVVLSLDRAGRLNETALAAFCAENKFEETVVALATLAKVPVNVVDRLLGGDRPDPVLILCRAIGLNWPTVKADYPAAARWQKRVQSRARYPPLPTMNGFQIRRRAGSCAFGRFGRPGSSAVALKLCGKPESTTRALRVRPWRGSAYG